MALATVTSVSLGLVQCLTQNMFSGELETLHRIRNSLDLGAGNQHRLFFFSVHSRIFSESPFRFSYCFSITTIDSPPPPLSPANCIKLQLTLMCVFPLALSLPLKGAHRWRQTEGPNPITEKVGTNQGHLQLN